MTEKLYYENPYQEELEAEVVAVSGSALILDKTIFYPEGGGQPHQQEQGGEGIGDVPLADEVDMRTVLDECKGHVRSSRP